MEKTKTSRMPNYEVAIVGSGFSGLGMGIFLKREGIEDFIIIEAASQVGGTWRDNTYPGAACDVPSHLYSYSFEQNPEWTRMFAQSEEIQNYILNIVEKYNLKPKIQFNTRIQRAEFDNKNGIWHVTTSSGETITARNVVTATGALVNPQVPDLPGKSSFQGKTLHTARWDKSINLQGKTVAVVGSGASAIQVVPAIAPIVKKLTVFQRTPSWIVPKADYHIGEWERSVYKTLPFIQHFRRNTIFAITELLATAIVYETPMTTLLEKIATWNMHRAIENQELREKLTPKYRLGCKRMLISNDWYPALARPNVQLVNHAVEALTEKGLVAGNTEYPADVIIWATGFVSPSAGVPFETKGLNDYDLGLLWKKGGEGYRGVSVHGFPNLFTIMGPNTGPGHTSVLVYVEAQLNYITQAIKRIRDKKIKSLHIKKEKFDDFNQFIAKRMKLTTWTTGCGSWYLTEEGRNTTLYPGFASEYLFSIARFIENDYDVQFL